MAFRFDFMYDIPAIFAKKTTIREDMDA